MVHESILTQILDEIKIIRNDISTLKTDVSGLKEDVSTLKTDVSQLKAAQEEDHLILKALEHKAETNKAEHDKMLIDISQIHGYYKSVSENIDAIKEVIGRHEIDITVLKRRPV